jgi:uncharacterized protein (UPF0335 family)
VAKNGNESEGGIATMTKNRLRTLIGKMVNLKEHIAETNGEIKTLVDEAVERHQYHKKAGAIIAKLDKMEPIERDELLYHFDVYREHMGWDKSADLLPDRQPADEVAARRRQRAVEAESVA